MKTPSQSLFAGLKKYFLPLLAAFFTMAGTPAQAASTNSVLILYDSGTNTPNASVGWIGDLHAKFLANLLGHFDLNYTIEPVENYQAGQISNSYATFYLGLIYNNTLPTAFTNDVVNATNPVCWFKYNMWEVSGNIFFPQPLDSRIGFRFLSLDETGFTNIVYKNIALLKNPADPELGVAGIINSNLATTVATAWETNAGNVTTNVPYITHGSNFWYVGDSPFDYMGEQDRYLAFCDVLHDILGINAPESHQAIIRLEDVTMDVYDPVADLTPCVDYLHSNNVPFCMATIPYYTDPLGYYNSGIPESHRISDSTDPTSTAMLAALEHATNSGGQILIHGYTHQYSDVVNPYTGVSADDFEFWRETLSNSVSGGVTNVVTGLYQPVAEDSTAWAYSRIQGATNEFTQAGLKWIGWETVHYTASAPDYQVFATNFNLTMQRVIYFADDYDSVTNPTHLGGQLFPYIIDKDVYGQKVVGETCGNYEESGFENYPAHSVTDILNAAHCALVVRDGWGNAFYHGFYGTSNLQQIVTGIQALGYTYVPIVPTGKPVITFQPVNQTNAPTGTNLFLGVAAWGAQPLAYQWWFNATNPVAGGTNALLNLPNAQPTNSGNYDVIVANSFGSVTSIVAVVNVGIAPVITNGPAAQTNFLGSNATFTVVAGGTAPLGYQWLFNDTNLLAGATNTSLVITNAQTNNIGNYSVVVSNGFGQTSSTDALLTLHLPPIITNQPASQFAVATSNVTFTVGAIGDPTLAYQWYFNVTNKINLATSPSFTITSAKIANDGAFTVVITNSYGVTTSTPAILTVASSPIITNQPAGQTVTAGANATFTVGAIGSVPLTYQWWLNVTNSLGGATNASLTVTNVQSINLGNYTVIVGNTFGSVTSSIAALNFHQPPVVTNPPASIAIVVSNNAAFSVGVSGDQPLSYQWWFNVTNSLGGATNATLVISNAPATAAGSYAAIVTNLYGSTTSTPAVLTIYTTPVITNPPVAQSVILSNTATFTVGATGANPLNYQWRFNLTNVLSGAILPTLSITNAQPTNAGNYTVVVGNTYGSVTSAPVALTVNIPPFITNQPAAQQVNISSNATFTVGAGGDAPLVYQWFFNATNLLAGATNSTFVITNAQSTNAGGYSVIITNNYGSVTSTAAALALFTAPVITNPPVGLSAVLGTTAAFNVGATGSQPLIYQWWFNVTNQIGGATNSLLTLTNVQGTNAGNYSVIITNTFGSATSVPVALTIDFPPVITNPPVAQSVVLSNSATFTVGAGGSPTLAYQWWFNLTNLLGATGNSLTISNAQPANAGVYSVVVTNNYGMVTSAPVALTVSIPPFITNQPAAQAVIASSNATFTVGAGGDAPLVYQWWFNTTNILAGATNSTFVLTNAQTTNIGGYSVIITNNSGSVTSTVAPLSVGNPVVITNDLTSQSVVLSNSASFTIGATGDPTITYQWWFNVTNLLGSVTGPTLTIPVALPGNAGGYSVVVSNPYNSVTSSVVTLTVQIPAFITNQPAAQAVALSSNATFTVGAGGDQPLSYQWWFNATNILTGATNSTVVLTNVQSTNIGGYNVVITNDVGSVTSSPAALTIGTPPTVTNDLTNETVVLSNTVSFAIGVSGDAPLSYQWWFNVTNQIGGATNSTFILTNAQPGSAGGYSVIVSNPFGGATSSVAALTVQIPPVITNQPAAQLVAVAGNATFTVVAGGDQPLGYQWLFNLTNVLAGAVNNPLVLTNVQTTNAGNYSVIITNDAGTVTSSAALLTVGLPPSITTSPTNVNVLTNKSTTFTVVAAGTATLAYQWQFNNTNILNATGTTYTIASVKTTNAGNYTVVVTNLYGAITSAPPAVLTVGVLPTIATQPTNTSVALSSNATFTVVAGGTSPFFYQWRFNTTNSLLNATNTSLILTNVASTNGGNYTVVVTNLYGSVTSAVATLTVGLPPTITTQPTNEVVSTNKSTTFTVVAAGTATLAYQWQFNNTNILAATGATYTIASAKTTNTGNYDVVVTNLYGSTTSSVVSLTVGIAPFIITEPLANVTVATNATTNFSVVAGGAAPLAYQWLYNGTNILNATNTTFGLTNIVVTNSGSYTVVVTNTFGSVTSTVTTLTVDGPPAITVQPTNHYILLDGDATFSLTVLGPNLTYQWRFNNGNINGEPGRGATYTVDFAQTANVGNYNVVVANSFGSVTSAVAILSIGTVPAITTQPTNRTVSAGGNTTFTVVASGTATLGYQWRFNTTNNIPNANSSTLTLTGLVATNAGNYTVVVTNNYGAVTSSVAALTINGPPFITTQPTNLAVLAGSNATFTVAAAGTAPLIYQWWFNATNLLNNATNTLLTLTNSALTNAGNYTVVVTNTFGSVTSSVAALTVNIPATPPFITNQPAPQSVAVGNNATFTVGAGGDALLVYQWWFNATNILGSATNNILVITNAQTTNVGGYSVIITNNSGSITSSVAPLTVGNPVVITNDLVPQSVLVSNSVSFTIGATGDPTLTYQWWFNVTNLLGSVTGPTLTIPSALPGNAGSYFVVVSNPYNSVTSSVVALTVNTPPFITNQPAAQTVALGSNATFIVGAGGDAPLVYQWWFNTTNILAGATNSTFILTNAQTTNIGGYSVIITNNSGAVTSTAAALIVGNPVVITNDLAPQSVVLSNSASFTIGATGDPTLTYQWWFNVTNLLGSVTGPTLTIPTALPVNAGSYFVVVSNPYNSATSSVVTLTVQIPPFITNQPAAQSVVAGNNASFTVGAGGDAPLSYQWWFNATNILTGATNSTFVLTNAQSANVGGYRVIIANNSGSVTSAPAALTVGNPVIITNDLVPQSVVLSNSASFTIGVTGDPTLTYHWWFNVTNLLGSVTGPTLTIPTALPGNAGSYFVIVGNPYNSVTSSVVTLTVKIPPFITNQPAAQSVVAGNNASFTVGAGGDQPLSYQWWFNATNLLNGATNSTFVLTNAQSTNVGGYRVIVANNSGSVTSTPAALTVGNPVVITNNLVPQSVILSNTATFTIGVTGDAPLSYHWWFNVTNQINGATNATLIITNAQPGNAGGYSVIVGNPDNTVTSSVAALTVLIPAFITNPPASQSVNAGSNVTFTVGAGGDQPLGYQWWFNATNQLNSSTNMVLLISDVPTNAAGNYTVVVTNDAGSVTSAVAVLTVTVPVPAVTNAPVIATTGLPAQLTFPTQTGFTYYVEYLNTLGGGSWQPLTNLPGTGNPVTVPLSMPTATRFYRVRVQ